MERSYAMNSDSDINGRGNHQGQFSQGVGGWAEYAVDMTISSDVVRHDVKIPPGKVIPIIFLPGIMGSNLRMTKERQEKLKRPDSRAWRPDDLVKATGGISIMAGGRFGGFFSNATPAERQLNFDPSETEVDYYHYTENKDRFDPEGKETKESDKRHSNVPDSLNSIPPLMREIDTNLNGKNASPAQIARWRGWSEVMFSGAYGDMLKQTEFLLNNLTLGNAIHPCWQKMPVDFEGRPILGLPHRDLMRLVLQSPAEFGATKGSALSPVEIRKIAPCWYPVHAMGYNFLKSNGESAKVIAERIRSLVKGYKKRHFQCDEVIIVTHSMGGLLGRALLHPKFGNLTDDKSLKILGIYHGAMPARGAAASYKRMRFGFQESYVFFAETAASLFGVNGQRATAVIANASGALELLPASAYGNEWLKVKDWLGTTVWSWPRDGENPLESIYMKSASSWWRLVNPTWVNPGDVPEKSGGGINKVNRRIRAAFDFMESIENTFHPQTYASYCASSERQCYGEIVFKIMDGGVKGPALAKLPSPTNWQLLSDDKKGTLIVQAGARTLMLRLEPPSAMGDETVPSQRSAEKVTGTRFIHGGAKDESYEHQNSYSNKKVMASLLYSIVKIATTANWGNNG
jgi:hypothetical protein